MTRIKSAVQHNFAMVPRADIPRSSFDRSSNYKTTFDSGYLVPVFWDEALPGDTFNLQMTAFMRLATPLHPFMDNMKVDSFFFAVPMRLIWDNWERFNGAQDDPDSTTDYVMPTMTSPASTGYAVGSLQDYFGLPTGIPGIVHRADPLRAYNLIYNEWFRDENLQDSVVVDRDDGPDSVSDYVLLRRGKRHDYFTSALPWPQKGPAVELPLTGNAPVTGIGLVDGAATGAIGLSFRQSDASVMTGQQFNAAYTSANIAVKTLSSGNVSSSNPPQIFADLSAVAAATINELRQAFQVQRLYERDARGGTRYTEIIRAHFGVVSPDARLQRPEYLGGGSSPINITPVAQTSASVEDQSPQGNLTAFGTSTLSRHGFTKSFTEHCIIIGLVSVRADLTYQQGLDRPWSRSTRFDFYWPALSHIGEQAILNKEIYAQGTGHEADDAGVFGYQERWAEYRYKPSKITGEFRSSFAQSLDTWHLSQDFASLPVLGSEFIVENPPVERVIAVEDEPQFLFDSIFKLRCARPMPMYSVPGLIDHF